MLACRVEGCACPNPLSLDPTRTIIFFLLINFLLACSRMQEFCQPLDLPGQSSRKRAQVPAECTGSTDFVSVPVYDSVWPQTVPSVGGVPKIWQGPLAMEFSSGLPLKAFSFVFCFSYREAMRSSCHANVEQGNGRAVVLPAWNARHIMPQRQFDLPASCRCWSATFDAVLSLPHPWWLVTWVTPRVCSELRLEWAMSLLDRLFAWSF